MNTQIDVQTLTLEQAKSLCYDEMRKIAIAQQNIRVLEARIAAMERGQATVLPGGNSDGTNHPEMTRRTEA